MPADLRKQRRPCLRRLTVQVTHHQQTELSIAGRVTRNLLTRPRLSFDRHLGDEPARARLR